MWRCCQDKSKEPTLSYKRVSTIIIKNAIILNTIHNIFNLRDTEVVICMILTALMIADGEDTTDNEIFLTGNKLHVQSIYQSGY